GAGSGGGAGAREEWGSGAGAEGGADDVDGAAAGPVAGGSENAGARGAVGGHEGGGYGYGGGRHWASMPALYVLMASRRRGCAVARSALPVIAAPMPARAIAAPAACFPESPSWDELLAKTTRPPISRPIPAIDSEDPAIVKFRYARACSSAVGLPSTA